MCFGRVSKRLWVCQGNRPKKNTSRSRSCLRQYISSGCSGELVLAALSRTPGLDSAKTCVGGLRERPPDLDPKPGILFLGASRSFVKPFMRRSQTLVSSGPAFGCSEPKWRPGCESDDRFESATRTFICARRSRMRQEMPSA